MTPHLKNKLIPESFWKGREKEQNWPWQENIKLSKRLYKMTYSYSKIVSLRYNLWLDKFGLIVKLP